MCFVQNTYYVKNTGKVPKSLNVKKESEILYYQWIPFLLLFKAFLFYIPRLSWNAFGLKSGLNLSDLVESSFDYKMPSTDATHRQICLNYVVDTIDQYCNDHRRQVETRKQMNLWERTVAMGWCLTGKYLGNYLVVLYMTTKLMYISISSFQIFLLSTMLGSSFTFYGFTVLNRLYRGKRIGSTRVMIWASQRRFHVRLGVNWDTESRLFPKTTLCDFTVREFGHPRLSHEYTVPCVLPLNLFNQQMFTLLYFWYVIVILMNIADFILWIYLVSPRNRRRFIRKRLHSKKYPWLNEAKNRERLRAFIDDYLEADGFFMLTLIKENSSDFVASEIVHRLYTEKFLKRYLRESAGTMIYDAIDTKPDDDDDESISDIKRRHHLCSLIC